MNFALRVFQLIALIALIAVLGELAWTIHRIRPKLEVTISNIDRTVIVAGAAATHLEKAAGTWQKASEDQSKFGTAVLGSTQKTLASLDTLVKRTDASLNESVLPNLAASVKEQSQSLTQTQTRLQEAISQMGQATVEAQKVLADADVQITNPSIQKSVDNLAAATQNTADLTAQAAGTMKAVRGGVEYEVAQIEKPVTKIKVVLLFILTALGHFFGYA